MIRSRFKSIALCAALAIGPVAVVTASPAEAAVTSYGTLSCGGSSIVATGPTVGPDVQAGQHYAWLPALARWDGESWRVQAYGEWTWTFAGTSAIGGVSTTSTWYSFAAGNPTVSSQNLATSGGGYYAVYDYVYDYNAQPYLGGWASNGQYCNRNVF